MGLEEDLVNGMRLLGSLRALFCGYFYCLGGSFFSYDFLSFFFPLALSIYKLLIKVPEGALVDT